MGRPRSSASTSNRSSWKSARALISAKGLAERVRFQLVEPGPLPFPDASFDVVFSKDAMVHIEDKAALYAEVLRVLKPGGWFTAADWLWAEGAAKSPVVEAWLSMGPLKFMFTPPAVALQGMIAAGFVDPCITDLRLRLQRSNRKEIEVLEGPARQRLAAIVGETMANNRLAGARGRQGALRFRRPHSEPPEAGGHRRVGGRSTR